ncbi:MAG: type II toxin-antitoxin system VapB family antitoxin [bacterium]
MRTTLDLPDNLIKEAMKVSGAKTKTTTICLALQDYIRRKKMIKILNYKGKIDLDLDIDKMRDEWDRL